MPSRSKTDRPKSVIVGSGRPPAVSVVFSTFCRTCGRDISGQLDGSRFCSPKLFGKAARRCRDLAHNDRRRALREAEAVGLLDLFGTLAASAPSIQIFGKDPTDPTASLLLASVEPVELLGKKFPGILNVTRAEVRTLGGECHPFERREAKKLIRFFAKKPAPTSPPTPPTSPPTKPIISRPPAPATAADRPAAVPSVAAAPPPIVSPVAPIAPAPPTLQTNAQPPPTKPPATISPPVRPPGRSGAASLGDVLKVLFPTIKH